MPTPQNFLRPSGIRYLPVRTGVPRLKFQPSKPGKESLMIQWSYGIYHGICDRCDIVVHIPMYATNIYVKYRILPRKKTQNCFQDGSSMMFPTDISRLSICLYMNVIIFVVIGQKNVYIYIDTYIYIYIYISVRILWISAEGRNVFFICATI